MRLARPFSGAVPRWRRNPTIPYALAHAAKTLFWTASDIYFAFYLTEICHIPALVMGAVLAGSYLVNAGADWISGRQLALVVRSARGAALLQFAGAALCSATLLLFGLSALVPEGYRLPACLVALLAFRLSYSLYDIPQNSLLALAARNDQERARLAAARLFLGGIARIALTASFVPLFVRRTTEAQIGAFLLLTLIMAVLGTVSAGGLAACFGRERPRPQAKTTKAAPTGAPVRLHLMMFILSLGTTMFTQLEPYLAAFGLSSRWQGVTLLTAIAAGTSLSQPVWMALGERRSGRAVAVVSMGIAAVSAMLFLRFALHGMMAAAMIGAGYGAGVGGLFFLLWTGIARHAAERHEERGATATLGAFAASAKLGQSAAMLTIGIYLQDRQVAGAGLAGAPLVTAMSGAVLVALALMIPLATLRLNALAPARRK